MLGGVACGAAPESSLTLGFGTYGLPGYSLADSIKLISSTGFDSIEIAAMAGYHGAPDQVNPSQRKEIRKQLADSGLTLGAFMGLPNPHPEKVEENREWVAKVIELALELSPGELPVIQSVLGGGKWGEKKNLFRDALGPWVELAEEAGVTLAIKPHRGHAMSLPEHGIWLIEQIDVPEHLKLVYDSSHFVYRDLDLEDTVAKALPYTGYVVMKDATEVDGKVRFALPGAAGTIPHAKLLRQFLDGGYTGEVCCEVSSQVWRADGYDPAAATRTCFANLTSIVTEAAS